MTPDPPPLEEGVRGTVLFADVVGSTALYRAIGNERAESVIRSALERLRVTAEGHGGRQVKTIGDCAMCLFGGSEDAATAALSMQRQTQTAATTTGDIVRFRMGLCAGPIVERDGDVFGDAVNVAARLCDIAKSDQVLTTEATASELSTDLRGAVRLFDRTPIKGVEGTLTIVQLLWDRRSATQLFVMPGELSGASMQLLLSWSGQVRDLKPADCPLVLGRDDGADLVVPAEFASRRHARIEYRRGKFTLIDESTNGTFVVPEGQSYDRPLYIRNEAFALLGRGRFALGARPDADESALSYEVS